MALLGAHVDSTDPLAAAEARGAQVVQFFLGDPQGWKKPPEHPHAAALRDSDVAVYIHSPYVINIASTNNRIRIPSRKILHQHAEAAAAIGAKGLVVHGGHVTAKDDPQAGIENWRKLFERAEESGGFPLPILIENTAGGDNAMARRFDRLAMLWDAVGQYEPGFVLDTCHAWAGGEELADIADRVKAITGRIDLVHANNSRDAFGSGADRHANFDSGTFDSDLIASVCRDARCDVIIETPSDGHADDLEFLRKRLS
ncbi:deoxyribonuclease IV [[Mycobacterium] burgundiense]|uniref:Deoxyribonuclease IV n=1 Tax=[Mycobacterium] burgundiense TaxID=3064286 RepID=A0ABM9LCI6_9MYCO|nr:deoxyribonuclease IV [Mycolicibacterium sp. MU0053]CAJ1496655.1 deoxyribonuclease IV [Mycolicibacterium sp. MU0053]